MKAGFDLEKLEHVITLLATGRSLPAHLKNHSLQGQLVHAEECHIAPDWLLIYERHERELILIMLRTGTHAQLFGA